MANRNNGALGLLAVQEGIELGGDQAALGETWDPVRTGHDILLPRLGNRVTQDTLRLIWQKTLTESDEDGHQNRFVIHINAAEGSFFRCLSLEQRLYLDREAIQVRGFDEQGREWQLQLKKREQDSNGSFTYVFLGGWTRMLNANGWGQGTVIKIWGFPYRGIRDGWQFGPEIYFVFTSNV